MYRIVWPWQRYALCYIPFQFNKQTVNTANKKAEKQFNSLETKLIDELPVKCFILLSDWPKYLMKKGLGVDISRRLTPAEDACSLTVSLPEKLQG